MNSRNGKRDADSIKLKTQLGHRSGKGSMLNFFE
jgi:hypothetical protein